MTLPTGSLDMLNEYYNAIRDAYKVGSNAWKNNKFVGTFEKSRSVFMF